AERYEHERDATGRPGSLQQVLDVPFPTACAGCRDGDGGTRGRNQSIDMSGRVGKVRASISRCPCGGLFRETPTRRKEAYRGPLKSNLTKGGPGDFARFAALPPSLQAVGGEPTQPSPPDPCGTWSGHYRPVVGDARTPHAFTRRPRRSGAASVTRHYGSNQGTAIDGPRSRP